MQNGQEQTINIYSIFRSINGEICQPGQGSWATFIRFAGCNLRCEWCDTPLALEMDSGEEKTIERIMKWVEYYQCRNVTITGGEPLVQRNGLNRLLGELRIRKHNVSIETNGSYAIIDAFPSQYVSWIVDYKLPSSGQSQHMSLIKPWHQLSKYDHIKFVIADRKDYDVALVEVQKFWEEGVKAQMVFSPILSKLDVNTLWKWMQQNEIFSIPINLQLHKLVNLNEEK